MHRILITNGILVSGGREWKSDILIEDGRIVNTSEDFMFGSLLRRAESELLDAAGCYVFPGFIDAFTRFQAEHCNDTKEPPLVSSDDFESGTSAALSGGTTSVINCAVQKKGQTLSQALEMQHASALNKSSCNYGFHIVITDYERDEREKPTARKNRETGGGGITASADGCTETERESTDVQMQKTLHRGVSSYTVHMSGKDLRLPDADIFELLKRAKEHKALICCHCENGDMVERLTQEQLEGRHKRPSAHPASRPPAVEAEAIGRFLALAQLADVPVCILHVSAKQSLEQIKLEKKRGRFFFAESCPHYLLLTDSLYRKSRFEGAKYICNPPLRKKQDQKALWKELMRCNPCLPAGAKDGSCIDILCSDHAAFNFSVREEAAKKNFSKVPAGITGAQQRPALVFTAAHVGLSEEQTKNDTDFPSAFRLTPAQFSALMSENAAKLFGLYPERGSLNRGAAADITVWDPAVKTTVSVQNSLHNCDYSPYENIQIRGQARYVVLGGKLCVKNGQLIQKKQGVYLFRKAFCPEKLQ